MDKSKHLEKNLCATVILDQFKRLQLSVNIDSSTEFSGNRPDPLSANFSGVREPTVMMEARTSLHLLFELVEHPR